MGLKKPTMKIVISVLVLFHHSQSLVYGPKIRISQGELQGTIEDSIIGKKFVAFKGIPYAKPPVGELRFLDPVPAGPWKGTLNASQYSIYCPQRDDIINAYAGSEDCLYLNVFTPPDFNPTGSPPKSVMFWIYGGSFNQGTGSDALYGPDYLVAKDVIVVTINYRLGVPGYLNLDDEVATGNQGLKDQVLALKWVQHNIAHFGGNPNSVTIFGESSGGGAVHYLALSSMADGLYHKVIAQSGVALNPWAYLPYSTKIWPEEIAATLGHPTKDPKELVQFLRTINATKLAQVDWELSEKPKYDGEYHFVPSVDSKSKNPVFPTPVDIAAQKGVKVPLLLGDVSVEGMGFLGVMNEEKWNLYNSDLEKGLTPSDLHILKNKGISVQQIRQFYFGDKNISAETGENYVQMQSDLQFTYGIHDTIAIQVSKHRPTYMYRFSYDSGKSFAKDIFGVNMTGVAHSEDLNYVFYARLLSELGYPAPAAGTTARLVVDRVTQMWTDFAKTGNPTPKVTSLIPTKWKPVTNVNVFDYMDITEDLKMEKVANINNRNLKTCNRKV